jgi:hypothetical protein
LAITDSTNIDSKMPGFPRWPEQDWHGTGFQEQCANAPGGDDCHHAHAALDQHRRGRIRDAPGSGRRIDGAHSIPADVRGQDRVEKRADHIRTEQPAPRDVHAALAGEQAPAGSLDHHADHGQHEGDGDQPPVDVMEFVAVSGDQRDHKCHQAKGNQQTQPQKKSRAVPLKPRAKRRRTGRIR